MDKNAIKGAIEAILFVAGEPVEQEALRMALEVSAGEIEEALDALGSQYDFERRGIRLLRFGKSVQLSTRPEYAAQVERLLQPVQRQNLTQAAMETLAVIAYRQPATRGDVEALRGVKCDYSVQSLLRKGLIAEAGKRDTLGRPTMFVTTDAFLRHFGIASLDDLPEIDFTAAAKQPEEGGEDGLGDGDEDGTETGLEDETQAVTPGGEEEDADLARDEERMREHDRDTQADGGDGWLALDGGGPAAGQ